MYFFEITMGCVFKAHDEFKTKMKMKCLGLYVPFNSFCENSVDNDDARDDDNDIDGNDVEQKSCRRLDDTRKQIMLAM